MASSQRGVAGGICHVFFFKIAACFSSASMFFKLQRVFHLPAKHMTVEHVICAMRLGACGFICASRHPMHSVHNISGAGVTVSSARRTLGSPSPCTAPPIMFVEYVVSL
jgi:hypothetical protein